MNNYMEEYNKTEEELRCLREKLHDYPKGSLRKRIIKGGEYYYLQFREGKRVCCQYVPVNDVCDLKDLITERKKLEERISEMKARVNRYAKLLGVHRSYRPVKNVNYEEYTLFMSKVAHDYKMLDPETFIIKYDVTKYRGLNKRYLAGFLDHVFETDKPIMRKTNDLVLDPYTYLMYYKYGDKKVLEEGLKKAIPAFLRRGLLITELQEAVSVTRGS
ncbi:MAG: hypothetical protein J5829_02095 [Lachnospiraceae bacterium]|nr:hypothetical protein [Lachnospiraceae bacterium]